jgi:mono/diheme cytochrome c family protein
VSGESWLAHLNRSFGDTSMGKTGQLGPGPDETSPRPALHTAYFESKPAIVLHGSDVYRLDCRGCHGELGLGAPPEINSIIGPVRATSVRLVVERMKQTGVDMSYSEAAKLAAESRKTLLVRLHNGGENMPAFPQLTDKEIAVLVPYLEHLAGLSSVGEDKASITESNERVGELIVKSTCHTCHDATGANPGPVAMLDGAIPPLSALTARKSEAEFVRKVTQGEPVLMGTPPMLFRGRMPVFSYLSEEEAADVYLYLTLDPPATGRADDRIVAGVQRVDSNGSKPSGPARPRDDSRLPAKADSDPADPSILRMLAVPVLFILALLVLSGGLIFTFREFHRLTQQSEDDGGVPGTTPVPATREPLVSAMNLESPSVFYGAGTPSPRPGDITKGQL